MHCSSQGPISREIGEVVFGRFHIYEYVVNRDLSYSDTFVICTHKLGLFVDKRTHVTWSVGVPPRSGNGSSILAQHQFSFIENFAIPLRNSEQPASSNNPKRVSHSIKRSMHCRLDSIERCVDVLARARIVYMQRFIIESQGHVGLLLKIARIPPLACKTTGPGQSRKNGLRCNNGCVRSELSHRRRKNLPVS
jgi:hypothetical protein